MSDSTWVWTPSPTGADDAVPANASVETLGGKGRQLVMLSAHAAAVNARVPRFVVIQAAAFATFGNEDVPRTAPLPPACATAIADALANVGLEESLLAVRSSATLEDGAHASFAGQFDTVLGVPAGDATALHHAIRRVWASANSAHARAYRQQHALGDVRMAVVLQELVEPYAAGVAFALDPVTGNRQTAVVSAVHGLGEGLVSGEVDADTWHVAMNPSSPFRYTAAAKERALRSDTAGGTVWVALPDAQANQPVLSDDEVLRVAEAVRHLSRTLGAPQDIEWALVERNPASDRELVLLQTRPITTLVVEPPSDPRGPGRRVWDNSNIVESYSGVTTPLTFTFARSVYEDVYRQFCRLMGVDEELIRENESAFAHMLGLVRGRVYYSLINWYRLIALLPGFAWNRAFMERMMGVQETLEAPPPPPSSGSRWRDLARLVRMIVRMIRAHGTLKHSVPAFRAHVQSTLDPLRATQLDTWEAPRIAVLYRQLEERLLHHWRPPLVNDFFAMIFFGVLGRLIDRWIPAAAPTLGNDLLCGEGGIISTEPARRVMALAGQVRDNPVWLATFESEPDDGALWHEIETTPDVSELHAAFLDYIDAFGDRCLEELKLETVTLREDQSFLIRMVRAYVAQGSMDPDAALAHEQQVRRSAEQIVRSQLGGWRLPVFFWVVRGTRARVRDRENLRFERTRVFGIVRRMMLGLGQAFVRADLLDDRRDVFWLTIEEVLAVAEHDGGPRELRPLVAERRGAFASWEQDAAPPDRFETTGPLGAWEGPRIEEVPHLEAGEAVVGAMQGTGCCPGVVRAPVRIVRDPRDAVSLSGCILVAERTDPGWTLLFPAARGLLVQRGSLLSHSAIVAREMALPCVVGIPGLLDTLVDGEMVEMNGTTGVVQRVAAEES